MRKLTKPLALIILVTLVILSTFSAYCAKEPTLPNVSVLGDSIASGYGLQSLEDSYAALIATEKFYHISNDAAPGHTTSDLLWVVCHDTVARENLAVADLVAISIGGNDILQLLQDADMGTLLDLLQNGAEAATVKEAVAVAKEKLIYTCTEIRLLNPDAPIIFQTQYNPLHATEAFSQYAKIADTLAPVFSELFNSVAQEFDYVFVADVYTAFDNYYTENQSFDIIQADGIHPSEKGHALIAEVLLETIGELEDQGLVPIITGYFYLLGDVNNSGNVNVSDATVIQKYLAGMVKFNNDIVHLCADADQSGTVNIKDATTIQKVIADLITDSLVDTYLPYLPEEQPTV